MKKFLLFFAAVFATIIASAESVVTFDFDTNYATYFTTGEKVSSGTGDAYIADGEFNEDQTVTIDGVTLTVKASAAEEKTRNRVWTTAPRLRLYNEYFTISAPGHKISKIAFKGHSTNFNVTADAGTLSGKEWAGQVSDVKFTVSKNTQINTITVTLDGDYKEPTHIANTPETAYSVEQANDFITDGEGLSDKVYVKGIIVSVKEISWNASEENYYGNATYFISDDGTEDGQLEVFRGYSLGGDKFTDANEIKVGDEVIVYGLLTNYNGTYEINSGSMIYSINGKVKEETPFDPSTLVGEGSLAKPYTIADVKALYEHKDYTPADKVWIKGNIVGTAKSANALNDAESNVASNIAIGTADSWVPVELPAKSDARSAINLVDNADNMGKEIWVYGTITAYFSTAGVKGTSDWSWDGVGSAGIEAISADTKNTVIFDLSGRRVNRAQNGVFIVNGKKVIR